MWSTTVNNVQISLNPKSTIWCYFLCLLFHAPLLCDYWGVGNVATPYQGQRYNIMFQWPKSTDTSKRNQWDSSEFPISHSKERAYFGPPI